MTSRNVVLGAQWGDEGKGKVVDELAGRAHVIARFNGGANAGHTIWVGERKYVLHVLPSGIVRAGTLNVTSPMVVHDLEVVRDELKIAKERGSRVLLDQSAPVVLPLHKMLDGAREAASRGLIGTTKRGIGPCYEDMSSRRGVRMGDLASEDLVRAALERSGYYEERAAVLRHHGVDPISLEETVEWCMSFSEIVVPHLGDARAEVATAIEDGKKVLFEGGQGTMLDLTHGSYPFVTSSSCSLAGVNASLGVYNLDRVIGVTKAYVTRVGGGPFPTELHDEHGERMAKVGHEFGATTGRPRRCGWLDLVALRYAARVGGVTEIALTKLDVLTGFETIKVCMGYDHGGVRNKTLTSQVLEDARPVYREFPGWDEDISNCRRFEDLPANARSYIEHIERYTGLPVTAVGVGPEREQLVHR